MGGGIAATPLQIARDPLSEGARAEYRAISQIRQDVGRGGIRTIVSVAMRRAGESPVRPIARIGCCVSPQPSKAPSSQRLGGVTFCDLPRATAPYAVGRALVVVSV